MHKVDFQNPNNKTMQTNALIPQTEQQQIQNKCFKKLLAHHNITQEFQNSTEYRRNQQLQDSAGDSRIQKLEN